MAGMFNAPCCKTCVHIHLPDPGRWERAVCRLHHRCLPVWLPEWAGELVLCSRWRHYNATDGQEQLHGAFPDSSVLYSYPSEYNGTKKKVIRFADLPESAEGTSATGGETPHRR